MSASCLFGLKVAMVPIILGPSCLESHCRDVQRPSITASAPNGPARQEPHRASGLYQPCVPSSPLNGPTSSGVIQPPQKQPVRGLTCSPPTRQFRLAGLAGSNARLTSTQGIQKLGGFVRASSRGLWRLLAKWGLSCPSCNLRRIVTPGRLKGIVNLAHSTNLGQFHRRKPSMSQRNCGRKSNPSSCAFLRFGCIGVIAIKIAFCAVFADGSWRTMRIPIDLSLEQALDLISS